MIRAQADRTPVGIAPVLGCPNGRRVALELYAWQGASLVAAALVSDARVPDLSPANVLVLEKYLSTAG